MSVSVIGSQKNEVSVNAMTKEDNQSPRVQLIFHKIELTILLFGISKTLQDLLRESSSPYQYQFSINIFTRCNIINLSTKYLIKVFFIFLFLTNTTKCLSFSTVDHPSLFLDSNYSRLLFGVHDSTIYQTQSCYFDILNDTETYHPIYLESISKTNPESIHIKKLVTNDLYTCNSMMFPPLVYISFARNFSRRCQALFI